MSGGWENSSGADIPVAMSHKDRRQAVAAMIAEGGAADPRNFGLCGRPFAPRRPLVSAQSCKRSPGCLRVARRHFAYQFEKQGQRTRRAFMLRRTMLR